MKRILIAAALVAGLLFVAAPAQADSVVPRLASRVMCVRADFPVTGSGWKVQGAIARWNEAQTIIRLTMSPEPGCAEVLVHRYQADDGQCGYTSWSRVPLEADGSGYLAPGADIYLNDNCADDGRVATRRTVAHELGHAMGLAHNDSKRSIMTTTVWYDADTGLPLNRHPLIGLVDVRALTNVYAR